MQKDKASPNNTVVSSPKKGGTKKLSRRSVLKSLILVPVNLTLWLPVVKAQRMVGVFPEGKAIPGDRFTGIPAGQANDLYSPNQPVGKAQGIVPGRVSWVWNPASTNPACANKPVPEDATGVQYDAWFMDKNTNQEAVDQMLIAGLCSITGKKEINNAWDAVFRFHNQKRGKGDVPYRKGEKIYIKLNRTSASGGMTAEYERRKDRPVTLSSETSPQIVLSTLRQLVNVAGVPQKDIYVGDAMRNIYQDEYIKYYTEFPEVNYLSSFGSTHGRILGSESSRDLLFYSDNKAVMKEAGSDKIYTVLEDAEYLINLPSMKGHGIAGITLCVKNHFGTQSRKSAAHLHPGLNSKDRLGYGHYRVLVDMMGNKYTGDKNLFYILDALWAGSNWNGIPVKFLMPPFDNHWSSSLLLSLDPVAIESVAFDFLRTEFTNPAHTIDFISEPGVDDYLHQAADSKNWPAGIVYTPNGDGIRMKDSIGVHEHWNNPADKQYTKNLGKAEGIELVKVFRKA